MHSVVRLRWQISPRIVHQPSPRASRTIAGWTAMLCLILAPGVSAQAQESPTPGADHPREAPHVTASPSGAAASASQAGQSLDAQLGMAEPMAGAASGDSLQAAEFHYRARRFDQALEHFGMIAAMQDHPFAWLRVGNIWHRRGQVGRAFDAYLRVDQAAGVASRFSALRDRAAMNRALLGIDQAQLVVEEMRMAKISVPSRQWQHEVLTRLDELREAFPNDATASTAPDAAISDPGQARSKTQSGRGDPVSAPNDGARIQRSTRVIRDRDADRAGRGRGAERAGEGSERQASAAARPEVINLPSRTRVIPAAR